jgi:hypothetical protein
VALSAALATALIAFPTVALSAAGAALLAFPTVATSAALAALIALAALLPSATVRFAARLLCLYIVPGVSGKGGRASAGATATSHAANHASVCVSKMGV